MKTQNNVTKTMLGRLAMTLLVTVLTIFAPITKVWAQSQSGDCGAIGNESNVHWSFNSGTLTISGTGAMADYSTQNSIPWFSLRSNITSVFVEKDVTSIGDYAFNAFKNLTSVSFEANSLLTSIGNEAFYRCSELTSFGIPANVTSIGNYAFYQCGLTSVDIPASVMNIGAYAFTDCENLSTVTFDEESQLVSVGVSAFEGTSWLNSWSEGDSGLLYVGKVLLKANNEKISENLTINSGTSMIANDAFVGCNNLLTVTIPASVTVIDNGAFDNCYNLTTVTFEGESQLTRINDNTFKYCKYLSSINIPTSVTSIGKETFQNCEKLQSINIPANVIDIGRNAFGNCVTLTSIIFESGSQLMSIGSSAFSNTKWYDNQNNGPLYLNNWLIGWKGNLELETLNIADGTKGIADWVFVDFPSLVNITIPNSVTIIGEGVFSGTGWYNNQSDGPLYLDNWLLGYKVSRPTGSWEVNPYIKGVANYAIHQSPELTSVTIPAGLTRIARGAFYGCEGLTTVTIPNGVTSIDQEAFWGCSELTSVTIYAPSCSLGDDAFAETNKALKIYVFSDNVDAYKAIANWSKYEIKPITLSVNEAGGELGNWCSYYNGQVDVTVPEGTTIYKAKLNSSENKVELTAIEGNIVKKGNAVLLKSTDPIELSSANNAGEVTYSDNDLKGVNVETAQTSGKTYYVLSKVNNVFGFYKLADGINLGANKAYIEVDGTTDAREFIGLSDDSTRLVNNEQRIVNSEWYTLDGRRLSGKPTAKGIYIVKGKKVIK